MITFAFLNHFFENITDDVLPLIVCWTMTKVPLVIQVHSGFSNTCCIVLWQRLDEWMVIIMVPKNTCSNFIHNFPFWLTVLHQMHVYVSWMKVCGILRNRRYSSFIWLYCEEVKYSIMYIIHMNGVPISLSLATGPDSHQLKSCCGGIATPPPQRVCYLPSIEECRYPFKSPG